MKALLLLEPGDLDFPLPSSLKIDLKEFDFIHYYTGKPNLTHAWNKFGLRTKVVERILFN